MAKRIRSVAVFLDVRLLVVARDGLAQRDRFTFHAALKTKALDKVERGVSRALARAGFDPLDALPGAGNSMTIPADYRHQSRLESGGTPSIDARDLAVLAPVDDRRADGTSAADIAGSFSSSTQRAYATDWRAWTEWCERHGRTPMPPAPVDVADHLRQREREGAALSSMKRFVSAIAAAAKIAGVPFSRHEPALEFFLKAATRRLGSAPKNARDELLTEDISRMLPPGRKPKAVRDRAILLLGYASGLRRSELCGLDLADLAWRRDGLAISIRRSKTDQDGKGQTVGVVYGRREGTCPLRALKAWLALRGDAPGPVFVSVRKGGAIVMSRLPENMVHRLVNTYASEVGITGRKLGAHSLRVGLATEASNNGADLAKVQAQLRHTSVNTTTRYIRTGAGLFKNNVSGKLGL